MLPFPLAQGASVEIAEAVTCVGSVTVAEEVVVQPFASVMVTL